MCHRSARARQRGLTLIEVMVALGVLVILVGGIFLVVQTALKTVLTIDNHASREDEVTNLIDILRGGFRNLPARARLTAQPAPEGNIDQYLFVVRDAPGFLSWLAQPEAENTVVLLALRRDAAESRWRVCMKRFPAPDNLTAQDIQPKDVLRAGAAVPWLELVSDFQQLGVRFYDGATKQWTKTWDNWQTRPLLIELTLVFEHTKDTLSKSPVLWVPPVVVVTAS